MIDLSRLIRRVLVTGACGSAGRYFVSYMKQHQPQVELYGTVRRKNIKDLPGVKLYEADLLDTASMIRVMREAQPNVILHLAGNPDKGFDAPSAILMNNAVGTANLFEAVRIAKDFSGIWDPVIVNCSTSEVYGEVKEGEAPIKETNPTRPVSPYGIAKLAQDNLGSVYFKAYKMRIITTRAFSYMNALRPDLFTTAFAKQVALFEAGKIDAVKHGNLDSVRTLMNAEDVARAYWFAACKCTPGEVYNIGGNYETTVGEVLERLCWISYQQIGKDVQMRPDYSLMRPVDVTDQRPDSSKFRTATGWESKFDLDAELIRLLDKCRNEIHSQT